MPPKLEDAQAMQRCLQARASFAEGRIEQALAEYAKVIDAAPEFATAHADRGTMLAMLRRHAEGIEALERAFALGLREAAAFCAAATASYELGRFARALDLFEQAIATDPTYPMSYYNRASVHHAMGAREEAIRDMEICERFTGNPAFDDAVQERLRSLRGAAVE